MIGIKMSQCASYDVSPDERCEEKINKGHTFCARHSALFSKLYTKYKKIDRFDLSSKYKSLSVVNLLKKFSLCRKAIDTRIDFREKAISYESRDVGHQIRIERLTEIAETLSSELKIRFTNANQVSKRITTTTETASENTTKDDRNLYSDYQAAVSNFEKTKKRDADWYNSIINVLKQDAMEAFEKNYIVSEAWKQVDPNIEEDDLIVLQRLFRSLFCYLEEPLTLISFSPIDDDSLYVEEFSLKLAEKLLQRFSGNSETLKLALQMVDNYQQTQHGCYVTTVLHWLKYQGYWYVGREFKCFIRFYSDETIRITDQDPEPLPTRDFDDISNEFLNKYTDAYLANCIRLPVAERALVAREHCRLSNSGSIVLLDELIKKIQIIEKLPVSRERKIKEICNSMLRLEKWEEIHYIRIYFDELNERLSLSALKQKVIFDICLYDCVRIIHGGKTNM
jgi:hypothetical protein